MVDREAPVLTLPSDITANAPAGSSTAAVTFAATATDNVGVRSTVCLPASGSSFAHGTTTVSCTATDTSGNTATGSFRVTVNFAITGRITDRTTTSPLSGVRVSAIETTSGAVITSSSGSEGAYTLAVPSGSYRVVFNRDHALPYVPEEWNHKTFFLGDPVTITGSVGGINAALAPGFHVRGRVTDAGTHDGIAGVAVQVIDPSAPCCPFRILDQSRPDETGSYDVVVARGTTVKLLFAAQPPLRYMTEWWDKKPNFDLATPLAVSADLSGIDAALTPAVLLSGVVSDDQTHAGIGGIAVNITDSTKPCCPFNNIAFGQTASDGTYSLLVPKATPIKINFFPFGAGSDSRYLAEWFDDQPDWEHAEARTFSTDATGINAALTRGLFISGHVTRGDGTPIEGLHANANDGLAPCCRFIAGSQTNRDGNYQILVKPGTYKVLFFSRAPFLATDGRPYLDQWWNGAPSFEGATAVAVTADAPHIDAVMTSAVVISGHVTNATGSLPVTGLEVSAQDATRSCCTFVSGTQTDSTGAYSLIVPVNSTVNVEFGVFGGSDPGSHYLGQWWNNRSTFETATPISATADVPNIDARLATGFLISGHVSESGGGALANVDVQMVDPAIPCCPFQNIAHTLTNAAGDYFVVVAPGSYKVQFFEYPFPAHPHMQQWWQGHPFDQGADVLTVASDRTGIDAVLTPAAFIGGQVTDAAGHAIAGAEVTAMLSGPTCCQFVGNAQTDAAGNYRFIAPIGASLKIQFTASSFVTEWWDDKPFFSSADVLVADSNKTGVNAQLARGSANSVSGRVTDRATGLAVAGMNVEIALADVCCQAIGGAVTDSNGEYTATLDAPATVKVLFFPVPGGPSYASRWYNDKNDFNVADSFLVSGAVTNINEVLDVGVTISGRVTDAATTNGISNVTVSAQPNFGCCGFGSNTDVTGRYSLVVGPGTYRISFFSPPGSDYLEQWWNNQPGYSAAALLTVPSTTVDVTSINAALVHGIPVRGTVTGASGAGIGQVGVVATLDDPAIPCCVSYQAQTATDGTYTMYVRAGNYRINFQPPSTTDYVSEYWNGQPDYGAATVLNVAGPTEHIDASLDTGYRITGWVTDSNGGAGVANVFVGINDVICCASGGYGFTGPDGTYSATVRAGTYTVTFNPPFGSDFVIQYWNGKPTFGNADHLLVGAARPNIDAVLGHGFRVTGRIYDAANPTVPLPGANVTASTAGTLDFVANAAAGSDGSFSLFLPAGDYLLSFYGPYLTDYGFEYWNDKADQSTADIVHVAGPVSGIDAGLARFIRISGRITDDAGHPVAGLFVNVDRPTLPFTFVAGASTDSDGRYSVLAPSGSYKVFFPNYGLPYLSEWWDDQTTFETATVVDASSSVSNIDAVLARGVVISGHIRSATGAPLTGSASLADANVPCCFFLDGRGTQADGAYSFTVAPGNYFIGFYAEGYQFQYWNGKTDPLTADVLSGAVDHLNIDAALTPIGSSPSGSSAAPSDGTSGAIADGR